jgi:hypothetical protein
MQQSPLTDKTFGIAQTERFADVRARSKQEQDKLYQKAKRNKQEKVPKYKIDDEVVLAVGGYGSKARHYVLVKVIDFVKMSYPDFTYYTIVLKITDKRSENLIGHLIHFDDGNSLFYHYCPANVKDEKIRWIGEDHEQI